MNFATYSFLTLFLIAVLLRLTVGRNSSSRIYLGGLLTLSLVFYAWEVPYFVFLLLFSALVDYSCGWCIGVSKKPSHKKAFVVLSVFSNLSILGYFKYSYFFIEQFSTLFKSFNDSLFEAEKLSIILPIGISFYTFQSMSYTIDIYRNKLKPEKNFLNFFLYIAFFPQLVAGPIVKAKEFLYQMSRNRSIQYRVWSHGFYLLILGLFYKTSLADNLAVVVDYNWSKLATDRSSLEVLFIVSLFSMQIYFDFKGYSLIARGLAYILGFRLPRNFDSPYLAGTFSDFWKRWHITLSSWLKEYLYFSLGGERTTKFKVFRNIMIVMLLGGLWHGASWMFVLWGALHGFYLIFERFFGLRNLKNSLSCFFYILIVQFGVFLTWIPFRSESINQVGGIFNALFKFDLSFNLNVNQLIIALAAVVLLCDHFRKSLWSLHAKIPIQRVRYIPLLQGLGFGVLLILIFSFHGGKSDFIYFKF